MNPLVSIIIPVYNTGAEAAALTEKLLKDKYENIEIILINDGSKLSCTVQSQSKG